MTDGPAAPAGGPAADDLAELPAGPVQGPPTEPPAGPVVYLLWCGDGSLYCGSTADLARRLREHAGGGRGAKYTRGRGPLRLAAAFEVADLAAARAAEARVKRLPRAEKLALVEGRRTLPGQVRA